MPVNDVCKHCAKPITWEGDRWVLIERDGTYDKCEVRDVDDPHEPFTNYYTPGLTGPN